MARNSVHLVTAVLAWLVCTPGLLAQSCVDALGDPLPEGAITRLGTTRMRHFSTPDHYCWGLGCITWSSDGKMIATTSYSDSVRVEARLWEAATGKPLSLLENNIRYGPRFARFTPDNKTLAAAARDKIVLWDVATGKELGQLVGHQGDVDALAFQDGGKTMVSVSRDGAVNWWDVAGRKVIRNWNLLANDPKKTDKGEPILLRGICHARFSADGKSLAVEKWWKAKPEKRRANLAIVYEVNAQKELWREDADDDSYGFAFAPNGKRLAVSRRGFVRLLEITTGRQLSATESLWPSGMDFSPDGKTLALCKNGYVCFWSPHAKTPLRKVEVPLHGGGYNTFETDPAFAPDGKNLAIDRRLTFRVLDVATGKPAVSWPSYDEGFGSLAFSADGRNLFESHNALSIDTATWRPRAASADSLLERGKGAAGRFLGFDDLQSVSVERTLCVAEDGKHRDAVFDMKTGRVLVHLKAPARDPGLHGGFFSPRASLYVMQDRSCGGKEVDTLFAIPSGKRLWQLSFNEHAATCCWSFSEDESRVAFFELETGVVHVHDTATGKLLWRFGTAAWKLSLGMSPDGNMLAVWTEGLRNVQIWNLRTGKHYRWLVLDQKAKYRDHACLAWSPDNRMLAVGGLEDSVRLWEVASGQVRRELRGHQAQATCLAFSRDGRLLASGSEDTTLLIWKLFPEK